MDKYEVTNALYKFCVDIGNCAALYDPIGINRFENRPIVYVNWNQAKAYCEWRRAEFLPTEAEWEKAARGTNEWTYPWGERIDCSFANYSNCKAHLVLTAVSTEKGKSPYGIYDMAGNVYEWVADWYAGNYYTTLGVNALTRKDPLVDSPRVLRGGGHFSSENSVRTTSANQAGSIKRTATLVFVALIQ